MILTEGTNEISRPEARQSGWWEGHRVGNWHSKHNERLRGIKAAVENCDNSTAVLVFFLRNTKL